MYNESIETIGDVEIFGMDSITSVESEHNGHVVVSGSHGGVSAGSYACKYELKGVFFNDAGVGKNNAGIAALDMLEERNVPGATYGHNSARIGDARDSWENGVISHLNNPALRVGVQVGESVREAARIMAEGPS